MARQASCFLFDAMSRSGTLGNVFHGSAVHLPGMTVLRNRGIHGYATKYFMQTFSSSASKQADAAQKPKIPSHEITKRDADPHVFWFIFGGVVWWLCAQL